MRAVIASLLRPHDVVPERQRLAQLLVSGSAAVAVITAGLATSRALLDPSATVQTVLFVAAGAFAILSVAMRATGRLEVGAWLQPLFGLFAVGSMSWVEAGLLSEALFWLPFVPLLAVLTAGRRGAVTFTVLALAVVMVLLVVDLDAKAGSASATVLHAAGIAGAVGFAGVLGVLYEQTRRAREARLQAALTAAESSDRAKSTFLANMSHELRTPLNATIGFSKQLLKPSGKLTDERRAAYAQRIHGAGLHLLALVDDVLDLSRIEAGRLELELETVELCAVVREAAQLQQPRAEAAGLTLAVEAEGTAEVEADRRRLLQVLTNLIANALKFTDPPGTVQVRLLRDGKGRATRLDVADTGIGIPDDSLSQVFEPFVQVDDTGSRRHEGTGLGLAISRELCRRMGFELSVVARSGAGSIFSIHLCGNAPAARMSKDGVPVPEAPTGS